MPVTVRMFPRLPYFCLLSTLLLLPSPSRSECLTNPNRRDIYFESCREGWAIFQDIVGEMKSVPSATYCANLCLTHTGCSSFNIKTVNRSLDCELSTLDMKCTDLYPDDSTRAYRIKSGNRACSNTWRLVLATQSTNVVFGSVENLQSAILSGATTRVLWEPYPLPEDMNYYESRLYTLDMVKVMLGQDSVFGYAYTYWPDTNDLPLWSLLEFDAVGYVYLILSNKTEKMDSEVSLSWVVLDRQDNCFQPEPLSHGLPLQNPAFAVENSMHMDQVSDVISVLQGGSTMNMISFIVRAEAVVAYAYPTYAVQVADSENTLHGTATWAPGDPAFFMPLRIQQYDFSGDGDFETHSNLNTTSQKFASPFKADENLMRTEVFLDACWELAFSVSYSGERLAGSIDRLLTAVLAGSRLLMVHNNGSLETMAEAEIVRVFGDNYVLATSKMGVTSDEGITWQTVTLASDGSWWFTDTIQPKASDTGTRQFYTDKTVRSFRYGMRNGFDTEGTWNEAMERMQSGLMPRVMMELPGEQLYFDVECVGLGYNAWQTYFMGYRQPSDTGFEVYVISMDGYFRADGGQYRGHGPTLADGSSQYDAITLFFEEFPNTST